MAAVIVPSPRLDGGLVRRDVVRDKSRIYGGRERETQAKTYAT